MYGPAADAAYLSPAPEPGNGGSKSLPDGRVSGPLEAYATGFREELSTLGYSAPSAAGHLQLMAHSSRWLVEIGLATGELTLTQAERFVQGRRDAVAFIGV